MADKTYSKGDIFQLLNLASNQLSVCLAIHILPPPKRGEGGFGQNTPKCGNSYRRFDFLE